MNLTHKLVGYLNRVFDRDPKPALALRLRYAGASMRWKVSDGVLTTTVTGGAGAALSIDLSTHTVASLAALLAAQTGYSVPYQDTGALAGLSALVLLDGEGDQDKSNGDHLRGYTSVLWACLDAVANELTLVRAAIAEALLQMSARTAEGGWVDEHGSYYNVVRAIGESDVAYASRIVAEVIKARGNNVAMGEAIKTAVHADDVAVKDYASVTVASDGTQSYGLFDVTVASSIDTVLADEEDRLVRQIIEVMRDAGTFLRTLRYIRKVRLPAYVGAVQMSGHDVTVHFG